MLSPNKKSGKTPKGK